MQQPPNEETRPKPKYWLVLLALVILTGIEVGVSYLPETTKIPILIVMAVAKAALVVLYFMHLKYDKRIYALVFLLGLVLIIPELIIFGLATP